MDEQSLVTLLLSSEGFKSVLQLAGKDAAFVINILDRVNFIPISITSSLMYALGIGVNKY
jgi:hypothetical protein